MTCLKPCIPMAWLILATIFALPSQVSAHPMGNFSVSHYTQIGLEPDSIELRYIIDMAEIPTFQEIQETEIVPEPGHATLTDYLAQKAETLRKGLSLDINGRPLVLQIQSTEVIFPPGAGGLPTMKLGIVYRARVDENVRTASNQLRYRDSNYEGRAGWKEIIAVEGESIRVESSSVPDKDRSAALTNYPTDLFNSPPQVLDATVTFTAPIVTASGRAVHREEVPQPARVRVQPAPLRKIGAAPLEKAPGVPSEALMPRQSSKATVAAGPLERAPGVASPPLVSMDQPTTLQPNRQETPRNTFTELISSKEFGAGFLLIALAVAAGLGAFHALEPGHGKTIVAAYLVGSRGTAAHALLLGVIVTASHTAGVYLLGGITLYASRYIVPERLYPWIGVISGLTVVALGLILLLKRSSYYWRSHHHEGHHIHEHQGISHSHADEHAHSMSSHRHDDVKGAVSLRELLALGVTGGIVPCPAALVVLLSALSLNRLGLGVLLIVAFSLGLALMLIAIGLLMVYAQRSIARRLGEGPLVTRWLPLTSSAMIAILGVAMTVQALMTAGIL